MVYHVFRRFLGISLLYIVVILGIFVIQFKNELIVNKSIGNLRITLHQETLPNQDIVLKNKFQIVYKGITLFADDTHPVTEQKSDGTKSNSNLKSYSIENDVLKLSFDSGSILSLSISGTGETEALTISSENTSNLFVPCRASSNFSIENNDSLGIAIFSSKNSLFATTNTLTENNELLFSANNSIVHYSPYTPQKELTFAMLATSPLAQEESYNNTIKQFRTDFVTAFKPENSAFASEKEVAAYIAESASLGRFTGAVRNISSNFKKETYFTAPYMNNLVETNKTMISHYETVFSSIQKEINNKSLTVFENENLVYTLYYKKSPNLIEKAFANINAQETFAPTIKQIAGILNAYCDTKELRPALAANVMPSIELTLQYLLSIFEQTDLTLNFKSEIKDISAIDTFKLAAALVRYGKTENNSDIKNTGHFLLNSAARQNPVKNTSTVAELYPFLVENDYYPHMTVLKNDDKNIITAWTCSPDVKLTSTNSNTLELSMNFTVGESHYLIITGLKPFNTINMYGLNYRSDPQFEMYNSPGYIYDFNTNTLLLKMRHKAEVEKVIFTYSTAALAGNE